MSGAPNNFSMLHLPQFVIGRGSISFFSTLSKKRIGIIKGGRSYSDELRKQIEELAAKTGAEITYLASIRNEPYIEDIFAAMEKVREFEPDMILAIGGGSVLDTAKAIHLFYENPEMTFDQAQIPFSLPKLGKKAVHLAVPTTSGTGSECTSVAVFIDKETKTKKLIMDNTIIPHYAILDADLTDSLPDHITVATGLDALTHAIEAGAALNASAMVKAISVSAATDLIENIPICVQAEKGSAEWKIAKEKVHVASALAGVAITNACTGIAHSYDHPGPAFEIPHGLVCGMMLPYTMSLCKNQPTYEAIANRIGTPKDQLVDYLLTYMKKLGVKTSFQEYAIEKEVYDASIETWSESSLQAFATQVSPAAMTKEKGKLLYQACYEGNITLLQGEK